MGDTSNFEGCITHGPWGGSDGTDWVYNPEGFNITKIIAHVSDVVDALEFYSSSSNRQTQSSMFGKLVSNRLNFMHCADEIICIDYPDEYLISISGTYGTGQTRNGHALCNNQPLVKSICFKTNRNHYGPFGTNDGNRFSYDVEDGVIVGFHGRGDDYINAIGVYVKLNSVASGPNPPYKGILNESSSIISSGMLMPRDVGPWGAGGGTPWDDGVFSTIKQVRVNLGELNAIYALQFEYLKSDGKSVLSQIHGGTNNECKIELVNLEVKNEFLIGISGFYGPVEENDGLEAIVSISFHSNVKVYGPYGDKKGAGYVYFCSPSSPGKVLGFQGRDNGFLGAIGVHMEYF